MIIIWSFNESGFQSIVEYDPRSTSKDVMPKDFVAPTEETFGSHLLVRSRVEADLDEMAKYDPDAIRTEDKSADYQFRMVIKREAVAEFNFDRTMDIDYNSHVKETINARAPKVKGGRMGALMSIWSACAKWQPVAPYSGGRWGSFAGKWGGGFENSLPTLPAPTIVSDHWGFDSEWTPLFEEDITLEREVEDLIDETMSIDSVDVAEVVEEITARWGEDISLDDLPSAELWEVIERNSANFVSQREVENAQR